MFEDRNSQSHDGVLEKKKAETGILRKKVVILQEKSHKIKDQSRENIRI